MSKCTIILEPHEEVKSKITKKTVCQLTNKKFILEAKLRSKNNSIRFISISIIISILPMLIGCTNSLRLNLL